MSTYQKLAGLLTSLVAASVIGSAELSDDVLLAKLSAQAEAGVAAAQYNLGMLYNNGIGTAQDPLLAFQWFEKAAKAGDPLGSYKVGCYYAGQFRGIVPTDADLALTFKLAAAAAGYMLAQHDVAIAFTKRGDRREAAKWWQLAAKQGDATAFVALADGHRRGVGVPLDQAKSYEYLLVARKLVPDNQARGAQPVLDELQKGIGPFGAMRAEKAAAVWVPQISDLTLRARRGIEERRQLAQ
jgi:uncharacterized protein